MSLIENKRKRSFGAKVLVGLAGTYVAVSAITKFAGDKIFGKKYRSTKKVILYSALGTLLVYNCHGDKIDAFFDSSKEYVSDVITEKNKTDSLKNQISYQEAVLDKVRVYADSVVKQKMDLEQEVILSAQKTDSLTNLVIQQNLNLETYTDSIYSKLKEEFDFHLDKALVEQKKILLENKEKNYSKEISKVTNKVTNIGSQEIWYVVQKGETLSGIAKKYYGSYEAYVDIASKNNIDNPNFIKIGEPLTLDSKNIIDSGGLRTDKKPGIVIEALRYESLESFVKRNFPGTNVKDLSNQILLYNKEKGNSIVDKNNITFHNQLIYVPDFKR